MELALGRNRRHRQVSRTALCEFVVVDAFLQAAAPEEGKLIHQLHSKGSLGMALNKQTGKVPR